MFNMSVYVGYVKICTFPRLSMAPSRESPPSLSVYSSHLLLYHMTYSYNMIYINIIIIQQ